MSTLTSSSSEIRQTKTGFRKLLLDQGGIHVEDALIEAIFAQVRIVSFEGLVRFTATDDTQFDLLIATHSLYSHT